MRKIIVAVVLALVLVVSVAVPVFAASSDTVDVTATPIYLNISIDPVATEALGNLAENSTTWAWAAVPADALDDATSTFTTTNDSSVAVNISISAANFTGGVGWTLASTVAVNTVVMKAGTSGTDWSAMVVVSTNPGDNPTFHSALPSGGNTEKWEFSLETGTFTDGAVKSTTITLQAVES